MLMFDNYTLLDAASISHIIDELPIYETAYHEIGFNELIVFGV